MCHSIWIAVSQHSDHTFRPRVWSRAGISTPPSAAAWASIGAASGEPAAPLSPARGARISRQQRSDSTPLPHTKQVALVNVHSREWSQPGSFSPSARMIYFSTV